MVGPAKAGLTILPGDPTGPIVASGSRRRRRSAHSSFLHRSRLDKPPSGPSRVRSSVHHRRQPTPSPATDMLTRILRQYLRTRLRDLGLVVALLLVQSIATLYLPNLNADIINNGVLKGDVSYIWQTGGVML